MFFFLNLFLSHPIQINGLNAKSKTLKIKLSVENMHEYLSSIGVKKGFLNKT